MYYLGVNKWIGDYKSNDAIYEIRIATSNDGMNWKRNGTKALSLKNNEGGHYPFSVLKVENKYIGFFTVPEIKQAIERILKMLTKYFCRIRGWYSLERKNKN